MSTAEIKIELFRKIDTLDENSLQKLYNFLVNNIKSKGNDFWDDLSDIQKSDIFSGLEDLKNGKKKNFSEVINSL